MLEYIMIDNIFVVIGGRSFNKDLAFQRTLDVIPFSSISSYVCLRGISVISQEKGGCPYITAQETIDCTMEAAYDRFSF
jgi:hypothetical protein